ncbi:MAG: hypothetical protein ACUVWX_10870 [Kiritimatiellia bacterium]
MKASVCTVALGAVALTLEAAQPAFVSKPLATRTREGIAIEFAVNVPTDVEVTILTSDGKPVRHLAAGVLGGKNPPPEPFAPGLAQKLTWDGKDDFGRRILDDSTARNFKVRVRLGMEVRFDRFLGADPYHLGRNVTTATDEDGNVYVLGSGGQLNQGHTVLRVFDKQGRYLREILPFPANLPKDSMKDLARWDEETQAYRPINRRNLNPDFYGDTFRLESASKAKGIVLSGRRLRLVLEPTGAVREVGKAEPTEQSQSTPAVRNAREGQPVPEWLRSRMPGARLPMDWNRLAVDYDRDEVYVSDGVHSLYRFKGSGGDLELLSVGGKQFRAADLAVGYDGLLYVRRCLYGTPGVSDFSGPFERYTHELNPAPYPSGTHVLSKYIYGRYGIAYADRGIGVGPDGTAYISFMYEWVKYCVAGFGPDGKPLKGRYLEGLVGNRGNEKGQYPPELTSAVIGPITGANGGLRVDLKGNIYLGMWLWPKSEPVPTPWDKDPAYLCSVGGIFRFPPSGGMVTSPVKDWSSDPVGDTPRTPGVGGIEVRSGGRTPTTFYDAFVEGATAVYPGYAPFSHANWGGNSCCVCRAPRFDLDRYGRLYIPNAIVNSVRIVDNTGNLICEFGQYGNFDSQYVPAERSGGLPLIPKPAIPLTWPTGAGVSEKAVYVLDTYSRRLVRCIIAAKVEQLCDVR